LSPERLGGWSPLERGDQGRVLQKKEVWSVRRVETPFSLGELRKRHRGEKRARTHKKKGGWEGLNKKGRKWSCRHGGGGAIGWKKKEEWNYSVFSKSGRKKNPSKRGGKCQRWRLLVIGLGKEKKKKSQLRS